MRKKLAALASLFLLTACGNATYPPVQPYHSYYRPQMPALNQSLSPIYSQYRTNRTSYRPRPNNRSQRVNNQIIVKYRTGFTTQATAFRLKGSELLDSFNTTGDLAQLHQLPPQTNLDQALETYRSTPVSKTAILIVSFPRPWGQTLSISRVSKCHCLVLNGSSKAMGGG